MSRLDLALLVYNLDATGGMERQARALAERLAARGARVRIVTCFWVDGLVPRWPRGVRARERHGRLTIARVPLPRGWGYLPGLEAFELAAAALLAARLPQVLYAVQWTAGVHAVRVGRLLERRVAVKLACGGAHGDMTTIHASEDPAALATLRRADRVICLTEQIEAEARAEGFQTGQLVAIPNGVDLDFFAGARPADLPPALADAERVLFVGALRAQKHLPSLLRALALLVGTRPRAHLLIVGDGEERARLEVLARELGVTPRVHFLGRRSDVAALLKAAHVFVLPSESEGLSNALLEALAAGVPVVASDIEGNRAVVEAERDALLVPLDDAAGLARATERILADPALARRLVSAGQERARSYAFDSIAARYERELGQLARSAPALSPRSGRSRLAPTRLARPSSLRILGRWLAGGDTTGFVELTGRAARHALRRGGQLLLERFDRTTIAVKRALGLATTGARP